jgi:hypothetical protein
MTANELAVYLEDITDSEESPYRQAATILRQQQAEIEQLNNAVYSLAFRNVLWQLTDEEILELSNTMPYANRFEFARAILQKASEK